MNVIIDPTVEVFLQNRYLLDHVVDIQVEFAKLFPQATLRIVGARVAYSGVNANHKSVQGSETVGEIYKTDLGYDWYSMSIRLRVGHAMPVSKDPQEKRYEMCHSRPFSTGGNSTQIFFRIE